MKVKLPLREIASARAGDKGDRSSISVWLYDIRHYDEVEAVLTPEYVRELCGGQFKGAISRYCLPDLGGFNFVIDQALEGGVNSSLNLDFHGKSFSFLLLAMPVDVTLYNSTPVAVDQGGGAQATQTLSAVSIDREEKQ